MASSRQVRPTARAHSHSLRFADRLPDAEVATLYETCRAFILPGEEDIGLTTGVLFHDATIESLGQALVAAQSREWDPAKLRAHAESFSEAVFGARFGTMLASTLENRHLARLGADDTR